MANQNSPQAHATMMRSMLGRARGLGAAKSGTLHWWAQRVTALALVPLVLWFIVTTIQLSHQPRAAVLVWGANPIHAALLLGLLVAMLHHMQLGLVVVIEDYVHNARVRMLSILAIKAATASVLLAAIIAVVRLAVG